MTKRTSKAARSTTPPTVNTMSVSEFVRGGLYSLTEPTIVVSHGQEIGSWSPRGQGVTVNYYSSSTSTVDSPMASSTTLRRFSQPSSTVDVPGLTKAVEQLHDYLRRLPEASDTKEEK